MTGPEIAIQDASGQVFAQVYVAEGRVEVSDPARLDEAAQRFWDKIATLAAGREPRQAVPDPYPAGRHHALRRLVHR